MIYTDYAISRIRAYLEDRGIARSRLAITANVPEGCTRNVDSPDWDPRASTLRKLEGAIPAEFVPSEQSNKPKIKTKRKK